jgi:hypothetical protein
MNVRLREWLILYQCFAGICDAGTGLLLTAFPVFILRHMGLTTFPVPLAYGRFVGIFVLSVGLSYLWTVVRWPLTKPTILVWLTQWKISGFIRALVAVFLIWQWMAHEIEAGWIKVLVFDGVLAAIQIIGLEQGWIERAV